MANFPAQGTQMSFYAMQLIHKFLQLFLQIHHAM